MITKTSTSKGREDYTAKFEVKDGRAKGAMYCKGEIVRTFDMLINMHNYIEVPLVGSKTKVRFRTK